MWKELEGKTVAVFDKETDGFLEEMTAIHCGTIIDALSNEVTELKPEEVYGIVDYLEKFDVIAGHNIIGFDLPVLKQVLNWEPAEHVIILDTLWMSRMYNPDLEGGHSLEAWGERLHEKKTEYYPVLDPEQPVYDPNEMNPKKNPCWEGSIYTPAMQDYCTQDVKVNVKLFWKLVELLKNFSWQSIVCEMQVAKIIQRQMQHGFVFDYDKAEILHAKFLERIAELEDEVHRTFLPLPKLVKEVQPKVKMNGEVSSIGLKRLGDWEELIVTPEFTRHETKEDRGYADDEGNWIEHIHINKTVEYHSGAFSAIEWPEFSLGSRQQIAQRLIRAGYKLTKFTPKTDNGGGGNAIIDDKVLQEAADAGIPEAKLLAEYFLISKREGMLKDWLSRAKWHEDQGVYRIHGYVNSYGAVSSRMTHNSPNVAQVPSSHSPHGKECRGLFTVRPGYKLVGCDASGLELRCLANYMRDPDYAEEVVSGDVHWVNALALELIPKGTERDKNNKEHDEARDLEKKFIYSWLYGAGTSLVAQTLKVSHSKAKAKVDLFVNNTPALKRLKDKLKTATERRDWLKGLDGRILRVRKAYAALNTLLQGMGAIIMKYWLIEVAKNADAEGLDWNPSANIHDEGQFEVLEKDVKRFCEICEAAFPKISKDLNLFCTLEGEAMVGQTWAETH